MSRRAVFARSRVGEGGSRSLRAGVGVAVLFLAIGCGGGGAPETGTAAPSTTSAPLQASAAPATAVAGATLASTAPSEAPSASPSSIEVSNDLCDPWLTAKQIADGLGTPAIALSAEESPTPPGRFFCTWDLADGTSIRFNAWNENDRSNFDGLVSAGATEVAGLGDQAVFLSNALIWAVGSGPVVFMTLELARGV